MQKKPASAPQSQKVRKKLKPEPLDCIRSWSAEMHSRAARVRQLIGDKHWLLDGFHKESLLREFLATRLPNSVEVSRGFVAVGKSGVVSPEVDVLISNPMTSLLWFSEGGLQIVPPSAVIGHIHVKTTLKVVEINDTFRTIDQTSKICEDGGANVWSCAFFFASSKSNPHETAALILQAARKAYLANQILPSCICCLEGPFAIIKPQEVPHGFRILIFDTENLSPAALLVDLFGSIPRQFLTHRSEMEFLLESAAENVIVDEILSR